MNEPEQTIMRTSLSRPQQLLGGDRVKMVILVGLGAAMDGCERDDIPLLSCSQLLAFGRLSLSWRRSARLIP